MSEKQLIITQDHIDQAKKTKLLDLIGADTTLNGHGELYGPCPFCQGYDRFHVKNDNFWFCRKCTGDPQDGGWLDVIDYAKRKYNTDFIGALKALGVHLDEAEEETEAPPPAPPPPARPLDPNVPPRAWQAKAKSAIADLLCASLWDNQPARKWLIQRGISEQAIHDYKLGYTQGGNVGGLWFRLSKRPERGIVIPHWHQASKTLFALKVRRPAPPGTDNKYYCAAGSKPSASLYNADSLRGKTICFVTEGELDTIALHSQIADLAAVVTLGSKGAKLPDRWLPDLLQIKRFYIATDAHEDEAAANYWLNLVGKRGRRVEIPGDCKDVCEAASKGYDLRSWVREIMNN